MTSSKLLDEYSSEAGMRLFDRSRWRSIAIRGAIPDRPAQFEVVADAKIADEIWRDLAIIHALHRQSEQFIFGWRSDGIAALGLVAGFGREADIDMLARKV